MRAEWVEVPIGELAEIYDGPHATPVKTKDGPIFLGISNLLGGRLDLTEVEHLSESDFIQWTRRIAPQQGDVVFSYETRLGEAALIPPGLRCCLGRRMGLLRARHGKANSRFLLYAYISPEFQETLRQRTVHGSTVDRIPLVEMPGFTIRVPADIEEQTRIADILGTLDDRIELNQRINKSLGSLARSIFKAWFIDFLPVRAKIEGATDFRGMPQAVFDRLPVELTDDEVPVGWHLAPLSQLMELLGGGTPKRKVPAYWNGEIPWFSVRDAPADANIWVIETAEHITQAGVDNSSAKVVRKGTTIISARGTVGRLALTGVPMALNQSCYGIQGADGVGDYFTYFTLHYAVEDLRHRTHGSVFDTITRQTFDSLVRVRPSQDVLDAFEGVVAPFMELIRHNLFENRTLRLMRDVLLPNLTSGKVRVPTPGANRG